MSENTLYIVATPIGNLKDITFRAVEILRNVEFIICEDTRVTGKILNEYDISKELITLNARNEERTIPQIINKLINSGSGALVSDAGTPAISDPGTRLVHAAHDNMIAVSGIPGANAAILALSISGLPTDSFFFLGFLPQKKGRQKKLKELAEIKNTIVLYESTYRIDKLLKELTDYIPDREISVCREMTKKFEEIWKGYPAELFESLSNRTRKGEFVVVIAPTNWQRKNLK